MSTASTISTTQLGLPAMVYRISVHEYDRMVACGVLDDPRVELLNWIVNLVDQRVEVYTQPSPSGYLTRRDYTPGQEIPVVIGAVERGRLAVSDILP